MNRVAFGLVLLLLLGLSPDLHAAAGEAHGGTNWGMLGLQVLNTCLLIFILVRYMRRPVKDFLLQRSRGIRDEIEAAENRVREAEAELEGLRGRLERFEEEAREIVARAAEQAEAERARGLERAEGAAERIRGEARRVADQEVERAREELQVEVAALATSLARELLRSNLTAEDDRRLVREYIEGLGGSK